MRPKFLIICAALGFVASFAAGLVGGVHFGIILLRSVLFGLFAAAVGFGLCSLAVRFLSTSEDALLQEQPKSSGSAVDITLGEEELGDDGSSFSFSFKPAALAETAQKGAPKNGTISADFSAEPVSDAGVIASTQQKDWESSGQPDAAVAAQETSAAAKPDYSGSEILPDMEAISGGFEKPQETQTESDFKAAAPERRDFDGRPDSTEMVKAIRTILAKDE